MGTGSESTQRKQWVLKRHSVIYKAAYPIVKALCGITYPGLTIEPFPEGKNGQFLYIYNHQTPMDQFFVSILSGRPVYHIATEDIMSNGWVSRLLDWTVAPIPILKQMKDTRAVKNCVAVARQGGSIAVAPEGNRTFSGRTTHFGIGIVKLIKLMKLPIAIVRIEGGYGVEPRWAGASRKGRIRAYVSRVIMPEEYQGVDNDEFYEVLKQDLWEDESVPGGMYRSGRTAEYLERLFYVCPKCGLSSFESKGDTVTCKRCGLSLRYTENKELVDPSGKTAFRSLGEWYDHQEDHINSLDTASCVTDPLYEDRVSSSEVQLYKRKIPLEKDARALLYGDRIEVLGRNGNAIVRLPFEETETVTVLGKKKLNIYCGGRVIQLAGGDRFNALKYVNLYYRYRNLKKQKNGGEEGVKFLGL